MAQEDIRIRENQPQPLEVKAPVALPDGKTPVHMGSGVTTKVISTGGGMAVIYEIWNPELEVKRAVKLLRPDHTQESEERFQTEMKISAKLHHPNIIEIYAVGTWNELPYIEMEEIDGVTLEDIIEKRGALPLEVCTAVGIMVGRALNYAHNQKYMLYGKEYRGVIHRDLKPSNIMVPYDGIVKLMDFGIAKPTTASIHTMAGTVVGTLQYLAPEQLEGKNVDIRADIYALGCVMYEMLTGVRAFPKINLSELVPEKLENSFLPLEEFRAKIPRPLRELVHKCMRRDPDKRVNDALRYLRTLGRIHKKLTQKSPEQIMYQFIKQPSSGKTVAAIKRRRNVFAIVMWLLTACSFLGALSFGIRQMHSAEQISRHSPIETSLSYEEEQRVSDKEPPAAPMGGDTRETTPQSPKRSSASRSPQRQARQRQPMERTVTPTKPQSPAQVPTESPRAKESQPSPPPQRKKETLLQQLLKKHDITDPVQVLVVEVEEGRYSQAVKVYHDLPKDKASDKKAVLYYLRALKGSGQASKAYSLIAGKEVPDGEFYLDKATLFFHKGDLEKTTVYLEKAGTSPAEFVDQTVFRRKLQYTKALCASALFDKKADKDNRNAAMEAWFNVKTLLRTSPGHTFYKKADEEIRRISRAQLTK